MKRMIEIVIHGLRYFFHYCFLKYHYIGNRVIFSNAVEIRDSKNISIGSYSKIGSGTALLSYGNRYCLKISENCDIGRRNQISAVKSVFIGEYVITGPGVVISDHSHNYEHPKQPIRLQGITSGKSVRIGRGTWIGANVVILPGTIVGKNCVIGANSVIKGKFPDNCVIVGSPGKMIKFYSKTTKNWQSIKKIKKK